MPTIKQRVNITADSDVEFALRNLAKRDRMPVAAKAIELLRLALDIEEDMGLSVMARERDIRSAKYISDEKVWSKLLK